MIPIPKKHKKSSPITESEYNELKQFQARGFSYSQIAKLTGRGDSTLQRVWRFPDLKTYLDYTNQKMKQYLERRIAPPLKVEMAPISSETQRLNRADRMIELLEAIDMKLALLVKEMPRPEIATTKKLETRGRFFGLF